MRPLEPARRSRSWRVVSLMVATAMLGVSACGAQGSSAPTVLTNKGTPYSDLLIPELTATVSDGSVGVLVDQPVTVSVQGGILAHLADLALLTVACQPEAAKWSGVFPFSA